MKDIVNNCLYFEAESQQFQFYHLFSYYRVGAYLTVILDLLKAEEECQSFDERRLISGLIKGVGICDLFDNKDRARYFYYKAVRTFQAYRCFPYPIDQIIRTAPYINASKFYNHSMKNSENFDKFLNDIKTSIAIDNFYLTNRIFDFESVATLYFNDNMGSLQ